jgi:hypothetical protein
MNWLKQLMTRNALKRDLAEEMRQRLEEKIEALIAEGLNRRKAEHRARREFGNVTLLEERSREIWNWTAVEFFMADVYYAVRRLVQTPGFTTVCLLTSALGIGVNTGIFYAAESCAKRPRVSWYRAGSSKRSKPSRYSVACLIRTKMTTPAVTRTPSSATSTGSVTWRVTQRLSDARCWSTTFLL